MNEKGEFRRRVLWSCQCNAFIFATILFLQISVPPTLGAASMFIGSPIFGRFADEYGARSAVVAANVSILINFIVLACASNVYVFFCAQLTICFAHAMPAYQMIISDISTANDRADALGKLGMCFGCGMLVGSILGGWIQTRYGERNTMLVAIFANILNLIIGLRTIPKDTKGLASVGDQKDREKKSTSLNLTELYRLLQYQHVPFMVIFKVFSFLTNGLYQTVVSLILIDHFKLDAQGNGLILAYIGVLAMVVQGLVVGQLTKRYSDYNVLKYSSTWLIFAYFCLSQTTSLIPYCIVLAFLVIGSDIPMVTTSSLLTGLVPENDTGSIIGIITTVEIAIRLIGPTIASYLLFNYGITIFGWVGVVTATIAAAMLFLHSEIKLKKAN